MGTPDVAATALAALHAAGHEIAAVYTRADKPVGRKQVLMPPPVKTLATELGVPVLQPASLKACDAAAELAAFSPDVAVVVAYGLMLPSSILQTPRLGCVNLHFSLLPKYRGAAPVQWAVINGEAETGVAVMQMDEGLDTGDVLAMQALPIPPNATAGEMLAAAAKKGAALLCGLLPELDAGLVKPTPQQGESTWAPQLKKADGFFDFSLPAARLHNLIRGCTPWPAASFSFGGKRVKVLASEVAKAADRDDKSSKPGTVLATKPLTVACGEGALTLLAVVPEGSGQMAGEAWAMGRRFAAGDVLA